MQIRKTTNVFGERRLDKLYTTSRYIQRRGPAGFIYQKESDCLICPKGETISFVKEYYEKKNNTKKKGYRASKHICKGCSIRGKCLKSSQEKRIDIPYYREEYERAIARLKGKQMMTKRKSIVEPVFGTLTQFMEMRKVFTKA